MLDGTKATATIDTAKQPDHQRCGMGGVIFRGSLEGSLLGRSFLDGTITGSLFTGTAHGPLSGTTLDIKCVLASTGIKPAPYSGSLHLHR